ncbi:MAG: hypothetical protein K2X48_13915 [Chitinophagaceae bacterium]|nr:hypothetical protein [Chitinophagaceae bacterium]
MKSVGGCELSILFICFPAVRYTFTPHTIAFGVGVLRYGAASIRQPISR